MQFKNLLRRRKFEAKTYFAPLLSTRFYTLLALAYFSFLALIYGCQRSLIYGPVVITDAQFKLHVAEVAGPAATIFTPFDAVVLEPERIPVVGTAIIFHGNSGLGVNRIGYASHFLSRGYRLVLAEYPGYGSRAGPISEKSLVSDGARLLSAIRAHYADQPVTVVGESLGSGIAVQVAAYAQLPPARLVLITPFMSMTATASAKLPMFPIRYMLSDHYSSDTHILGYSGPIGVLVADNDTLVTAAAGVELYDVARKRGDANLVRISNAGHNDWFSHVTNQDWDRLLGATTQR